MTRNRYQLIRPLGGGSFGTVHLAWDNQARIFVAVKILKDLADLDRFAREARILYEESGNGNVVRLLGCYLDEPQPFIVLEYCDEGALTRWTTERRPWQDVAMALAHVSAGLAPLHAKGGFHRDLKPGNLLLATDSARGGLVVKVADFGLARRPATVVGGMTRSTGGTEGYIAPETLRGVPFDARADIYSLGVVALELLTGGRDVRALRGVPDDLHRLIGRTLSEDPAVRPTASQIQAVLLVLVESDARARRGVTASASEGPTLTQALFGGLALLGALGVAAAAAVVLSDDD